MLISSMPALHAPVAWLSGFFLISLLLTMTARSYAVRRRLIDKPGERRSHQVATPRGGGIAIVIAMLLAIAVLAWLAPELRGRLGMLASGLVLVSGIGWWDDHRPLPPLLRLAVHAVSAGLLALVAHQSSGSLLITALSFVLTIVLVNIWNFMDGINGIATTQALVVALAVAILGQQPAITWLSLALVAACAGFLPFNLVNARIFLGDVGSGALGYLVAMLIVLGGSSTTTATQAGWWLLMLLPPAAFLVDASLTLVLRIVRGQQWWKPHVQHAYQRWTARLGSHWPVMVAYTAFALVGALLAHVMHNKSLTLIIVGLVAWYLGGGILWLWIQSKQGKGLPGS